MAYSQLTLDERFCIYQWSVAKWSMRKIARLLGRSHSTIVREVQRNSAWKGAVYWHESAQKRMLVRRRKPRHARRLGNSALCHYVREALQAHWSPQTICGRIERDHPRDPAMRVSPETIYRWIYRDAGLGGSLHKCLRFVRRNRRRQCRYGAGRRHIAQRTDIKDRPDIVTRRARFGDWEGDSVIGKGGRSAVCTQLERKSRFLVAVKLEDRTSKSMNRGVGAGLGLLPQSLRRTLTVDNGSEFARFQEMEKALGIQVYFAEPYKAWQRGANENANGLLRRYLPKGTDFDAISQEQLARIVEMLNHRPRRCLQYRTPHEVFYQAFSGALAM